MERKLNNKGFSLVELIVVIAIMVVLVGITSAVILKYMDRTKYAKDISALDTVNTAINMYVSDPEAVLPDDDEEISLKALITGVGSTVYDPNEVITSALQESFVMVKSGGTYVSCDFRGESNMFKDIDWEDIYINIDNGAVSVVAPIKDGYDDKYAPYIAGSYEWSAARKVKE